MPSSKFEQYTFVVRDPETFSPSEWEKLANLTRFAFAERVEAGLHMMPNHITANGLKKRSSDSLYFCAVSESLQEIVAYLVSGFRKNEHGVPFCEVRIVACDPRIKRQGVASKLYAMCEMHAKETGCHYISSDTGERVTSSIKWHKKMGFSVCGYTHFAHTNYYSVLFRKYFRDVFIGRVRMLISRMVRWCMSRFCYSERGQRTSMFRIVQLFRCKKKSQHAVLLQLSQVQQISYKLLENFVRFCEGHGLRYMVCYGTLLGAVRHKGFIPWDDDIDVTMPLPDYERFLQLYEHEKNDTHYELLMGVKKGASIPYAMLADNRTITEIPARDKEHSKPIAIDIFPAYPVSDSVEEVYQHIEDLWKSTQACYRTHKIFRKNPLKSLYLLLFANRDERKALDKLQEDLHRYSWGSTQNVRIFSLEEKELLLLPAGCFDDYDSAEFEQLVVRIPKQFNEHLSECYGDYMQLPPENKRSGCLGKCYWLSDEPLPEREVTK